MDVDMDPSFTEAMPEYMNLYDSIPTQVGIKKKKYIEVSPVISIDSSTGPIQFQITAADNELIYPSGIKIMSGIDIRDATTKTKLLAYNKTDKTTIKEGLIVPVEGMGHAIFSDIIIYINDQKQDGGDAMYAYKGAIQNKLFTNIEQKKGSLELKGMDWRETVPFETAINSTGVMTTHLGANGEISAIPDKKNDTTIPNYVHPFIDRFHAFQSQNFVHYIDELYNSICQQPKPLPPGTKLTIQLIRSRPQFCLLSQTEEKDLNPFVHFEYCKLIVPVLVLEDKLAAEIKYPGFKQHIPFKYPMRKIDIQTVTKTKGISDLSIENVNIQSGAFTPRRMFIGFVEESAFTGNYAKDPFNFQWANVAEISCKLGGQISDLPILKCPSKEEIHIPVHYLLQTLDSEGIGSSECGITRKNFTKRNAIYAFDLSGLAGIEYANCFTRDLKIPCGLNIRLHRPLTEDMVIIIYKEYDYEEQIDAYGKLLDHM